MVIFIFIFIYYFAFKVSWTHALRQIVINCYKYHGREDLLPAFTNEDDKEKTKAVIQAQNSAIETLAGAQGVRYFTVYNYPASFQDFQSLFNKVKY